MEVRRACGLVSREEGGAHFRGPRAGQGRELGEFHLVVSHAAQSAVLDITERAQHAGDVAQGGMFGAPLFDAVAGFAFEVDDHEVVARHQNLSEVIVAVDAYLLPLARLPKRPLRDAPAAGLDAPVLRLPCRDRRPESARGGFQQCKGVRASPTRALPVAVEVRARQGLGIEVGIAGAGGKRGVQLGGALRQHANQEEDTPRGR